MSIADWYESLRDKNGISCCNQSDCRPARHRTKESEIEVFIDRKTFGPHPPDSWVAVPPDAILRRHNPTGSAVACYYRGRVACFVRGLEG